MTDAEWTRIKRRLVAGWISREAMDDEAYRALLSTYSADRVIAAVESLLGTRFMPKVSEIVTAINLLPPKVEPCTRTAALDAEWAPVLRRAHELVGDKTFGLWLEPLHAHRFGSAGWIVAGPPEVSSWADQRLGAVLAAAAGVPVRVHACGAPA